MFINSITLGKLCVHLHFTVKCWRLKCLHKIVADKKKHEQRLTLLLTFCIPCLFSFL